MIKLVITDMDGTLLSDKKEIDPSFWVTHQQLMDRGILFSVASGRQIHTLEATFADIKEGTLFIAENGTYVRYMGEDVYMNSLDTTHLAQIIESGRQLKGAELVICCKNSAYIEHRDPAFIREVSKYYHHLQVVDDLTQINDTVLKVAIYDCLGAETNSYHTFSAYAKDYKVTVSGPEWLDITNLTANKGTAIERAQKKLGILKEETMAFGDFLNDLEMMQAAGHSFAMKNAHPEIVRISRFITEKDNNNNGVVDTIQKKLIQIL
jgi:Cof subfamily protein (haloacid dehalogenase superfamily)